MRAAGRSGCRGRPGAVRDILLARFWHLSEDARELVARVVAVAGSPVSEARLATVVELAEKQFAAALREALDLRVLAPTEGGLSIRHVLMAEAVYGELLSGERVRLHARWAAVLADAPAPLVAHHWYEAGEDDLAFVAGLAAAREATGALAFDDAHRHYRRVLTLWTRRRRRGDARGQPSAATSCCRPRRPRTGPAIPRPPLRSSMLHFRTPTSSRTAPR